MVADAAIRVTPSDARIAHAAIGLTDVIPKLMFLVVVSKINVSRALGTLALGSPERDGPHRGMHHCC